MHAHRGERSHKVLLWMLGSEMLAVLMGKTVADKQLFPLNADVQTLLAGIQPLCGVSLQRNTSVWLALVKLMHNMKYYNIQYNLTEHPTLQLYTTI